MKLYLMRHADALDVGEAGASVDSERILSAKGRKQSNAMACALQALDCRPRRVVSSPLIRARETAEIVAEVLGVAGEVETADHLSGGGDIGRTMSWLQKRPEESLLLVGHMPDMAELGARLVSSGPCVEIVLKKAGVLHVSFEEQVEPGSGCIEWLLQSGMVKALCGE